MPALYNTNKDLPKDMVLGNLLFYNLIDMTVSEQDLLDTFSNNNLSQNHIRKISHPDAFRRATSSIKNTKVLFNDDVGDVFDGRINVDEVVNDNMYIKRIVGVRVLNDQKEEVSYVQLGSVIYDRANDYATYAILNSSFAHVSNCQSLFDLMINRYKLWSTYHNHDTIKNLINRVVDSMNPIALMPTGICKFIPKSFNDTLYGLEGALESLSQYSDKKNTKNIVEIIPIVDTQEHRDLVDKVYQGEIQQSLYDYSMELTDILKNKQKLSSRQASTYLKKYKDLTQKAKDYQDLLQVYTGNITSQLKTAIQYVEDNTEEEEEDV